MAAGNVTVKLVLNNAGYSAGIADSLRKMKQLEASTKAMGHTTVSSMQASSAAIRVLEGGMTGNIRAAERFIGMLPGIGSALKAAFPVIGGIALAGVFVKMGEEAFKAVKKVRDMQGEVRESFLTISEGAQKTADSMRVTNDKIEQQIALLEHKPVNTVALALDEARVRADELAISLNKDYTELRKLLDANQVGILGRILGKGSTGDVSNGIKDRAANLRTLGLQAQQQTHDGDTAGADATGVLIRQAQEEALKWAKDQVAMRTGRQQYQDDGSIAYGKSFKGASTTYAGANGDQGVNLEALQGFQGVMISQEDTATEGKRNTSDTVKLKQLEDAKAAAAYQKQLQEQIVAQWRNDYDEAKAENDMTLAQDAQFWVRRMETARVGSLSYKAALDEANRLIGEMRGKNMREGKEFSTTSAGSYALDAMDKSRADGGELRAGGIASVDYLKSLNEGIRLQSANKQALAEASLQLAVYTGQMSRAEAATVQAQLHTQEFAAAMKDLATAKAAAAELPDGLEKQTRLSELNNTGAQMVGQRSIQTMQDRQDILSTQIGPAVKQALDEMVQKFDDMASTLKVVIPRLVDGLNDDIARLATGQGKKGDFGKTFLDAGQGLVKGSLQKAEGMGLSFLTHGAIGPKRDGSSALAALYVTMAEAGIGAPASIGLSSPTRTAMIGLQDLVPGTSFIRPFQGAFANGGDVVAGRPALVGEFGPELFTPPSAGKIVSNDKLGGGDTHIHVDARGAQDPAAVHAAVMRAAPSIVAAALQAQQHASKRGPSGR